MTEIFITKKLFNFKIILKIDEEEVKRKKINSNKLNSKITIKVTGPTGADPPSCPLRNITSFQK